MHRQRVAAIALAIASVASAAWLAVRAQHWNDELALVSPLARMPALAIDPHTPKLARRVVMVVIDGLGVDESHLPFLDELRARGASTTAHVPYPTISRPNYVTLLSGVPPADSGVRANRVRIPVTLDTVLDRARVAGMRVATASDFGMLPSLFVRGASSLTEVRWTDDNQPMPPASWPVDVAERSDSLAELGPSIARLAASDASLVTALVLDVDRAGHAHGIGDDYRAAARATDAMLRVAFAHIDLSRDAVIVTADHGHVAPGGHGGIEREVSTVPLVLAGAGIVPHAVVDDAPSARSIDIAPTVAALLGVPSPGHAEGRALVGLLALSPDAAARRATADRIRTSIVASVVDAAQVDRPDVAHLVIAALLLAIVIAIGRPRALVGTIGIPAMLVALGAMTRWQFSPSYVPSLPRVELIGGVSAIVATTLQVVASYAVIRRATDRRFAGNRIALVGLASVLATVAAVRAWYAPPFVAVPPPFWFVAVPAIELGAATACLAIAITLAIARNRG
ncbi:MAG TPA: alkaline phosphatase family protein [Kofleriaceae bacterium]